jgi:hypothetical protein
LPSEEDGKKKGSKFLNLTISRTFAFPKKTVDQCDRGDCGGEWIRVKGAIPEG